MLRLEFHTNEIILFLVLLFFILIKNYFNESNLFLDSVHNHWIQGFVHDNQTVYQLRYMPVPYPSGFCRYHTSFWKKSWALKRCVPMNVMTFPVCCLMQWTWIPLYFISPINTIALFKYEVLSSAFNCISLLVKSYNKFVFRGK